MNRVYANVQEELAALDARRKELQQKIEHETKQQREAQVEAWRQTFLELLEGTSFEVHIQHKVQIAYDDESWEYGDSGLEWFPYLKVANHYSETLYKHLRERPNDKPYNFFSLGGVHFTLSNSPYSQVQVIRIEGEWPAIASFVMKHNLKLTETVRMGWEMSETRAALDEMEASLKLMEEKGLCDLSK